MQYSAYLPLVRQQAPLVSCYTNFVTVNDCANLLLAAGARPIMSCDSRESEEICAQTNALVLNIGTPTDNLQKAMFSAIASAHDLEIPVILDPVGCCSTELRLQLARELAGNADLYAIRGNAAEIMAMERGEIIEPSGVDSLSEQNPEELIPVVSSLANTYGTVVCASGPVDVISDGSHVILVRNGHPMLPRITGSGCMSTVLIAAFAAVNDTIPLRAAAAGVVTMGIAGELAARNLTPRVGVGTYRTLLIDAIDLMTEDDFEELADYEERRA